MRELAEPSWHAQNARVDLVTKPLPQDDPRRRCPDITLARERLGWEPRVPLEHGLDRTIAYFESVLRRDGARAAVHHGPRAEA